MYHYVRPQSIEFPFFRSLDVIQFSRQLDYFEEKYNKLMEFESQKDRWYFKKDLQKSFHSNFQSYKKKIKNKEKFRLIQLYKI